MTNEVSTATRPAPMMAGGKVHAIVPQSMEEVWRLAGAVVDAGMAPEGMKTREQVTIAMMHGLEVGLTPLAAIQRIAVIGGRPTIWGDAVVGLVRGSGLVEWIKETVTGEGDKRTATCEAKRKGEPESIARKFSVAEAKAANLWNKKGPWQQYPDRMLSMRARAFCLRDGFADVLGGLYLREEIEDEPAATAALVPPPAPPAAPPESARVVEGEIVPPKPKTEPRFPPKASKEPEKVAVWEPKFPGYGDMTKFFEWVEAMLKTVATDMGIDALEVFYNAKIEPRLEGFDPVDRDQVVWIYEQSQKRFETA